MVFGAVKSPAPTTEELIDAATILIAHALNRAKKPVIAWSGGKDSQVMLHLVRRVRADVPVFQLRGFADPQKHAFADEQIKSLGLNVIEPTPIGRDVVAKGDHVEIIEEYRLDDQVALYFPIEPEPDHRPGPGSHCAVEKLNQPCDGEPLGADCVFVGARADDVDPVYGAVPLEHDTVETNGVTVVYPLKDWTEANIWEASELLNVPQNKARYERKDMDANADYFPMCVECLKAGQGDSLLCPKLNEPVFRLGNDLDLARWREDWRNTFINIRKE